MAAHVLHLGMDDCHRVAVLRSVGYGVEEYATLPQLAAGLDAIPDADGVLLSESENIAPDLAVAIARHRSAAPVILFRRSNRNLSTGSFDLVISPLTPPENWLMQVCTLVEQCRVARAQGKLFVGQPGPRGLDTGVPRRPPLREREPSRRDRSNSSGVES